MILYVNSFPWQTSISFSCFTQGESQPGHLLNTFLVLVLFTKKTKTLDLLPEKRDLKLVNFRKNRTLQKVKYWSSSFKINKTK